MHTENVTPEYVLYTDPISEVQYLRIRIDDVSELSYLHHSLLESIIALTAHEKDNHKEIRHGIYWIAKILQAGYTDIQVSEYDEF